MRTRPRLADRMMRIMMDGVSTRRYKDVIPEMAQSVGVSKSAVSRANIEAGEKLLRDLAERRFDHLEILIIYLDAICLGDYHILGAIGVDSTGSKHVLGLREGSSENAAVAIELLNDLVARGVKAGSASAVRDRRGQGVAQRDQRGVRIEQPGAALSDSQAAERDRAPAQGSAPQRAKHALCGVEAGCP